MNTKKEIALSANVVQSHKGKPMDETALRVQQRFEPMAVKKQNRRTVWDGIQSLYYCDDWQWIITGEIWDQQVRMPTLRDVTKSLTDQFMASPPEVTIRPKCDDDIQLTIGKKAYLQHRSQTIHEKQVRRQVIEDMFFYGVGVRFPSYTHITKEYPNAKKPHIKEEIDVFNDIASSRGDPRHWFVDENADVLHDDLLKRGARDAIYRHVIPYSTFVKTYGNNPKFDTRHVMPLPYFEAMGHDYLSTNTREIEEKGEVMVVKLYEYMNQETDEYALVANGATIFEGSLYLSKGTRALPVVDYQFEHRNDSYWGQSLGELIAPHIYTRDTVFNLELMNLKLTLQPILAVSGDFGYNPKTHILQPGGVWTATGVTNGKINDHIQPLITGNPNTRSAEMIQMINGELSVSSRTDIRNLQFIENKTATEVLSSSQSMRSHNDYVETVTEIESEARLYTLWDQQMQTFMDADITKDRMKRRVPIENYAVSETGERGVLFKEKHGMKDIFSLTQEIIDVQADITVMDKRGDKVMREEKTGKIMQFLPIVGNLGQLHPESVQNINFNYLIEEAVKGLDLDPTKVFSNESDYLDEFELVKEEILIGNKVPVPEESRKDSLVRLKWLTSLYKHEGKDFTVRQKAAFMDHYKATTANILTNHMERKRLEEQMQGQEMMQQQAAQGLMSGRGGASDAAQIASEATRAPGGSAPVMPMPDGNIGSPADKRNTQYKPQ